MLEGWWTAGEALYLGTTLSYFFSYFKIATYLTSYHGDSSSIWLVHSATIARLWKKKTLIKKLIMLWIIIWSPSHFTPSQFWQCMFTKLIYLYLYSNYLSLIWTVKASLFIQVIKTVSYNYLIDFIQLRLYTEETKLCIHVKWKKNHKRCVCLQTTIFRSQTSVLTVSQCFLHVSK